MRSTFIIGQILSVEPGAGLEMFSNDIFRIGTIYEAQRGMTFGWLLHYKYKNIYTHTKPTMMSGNII